jgi:hypothetical protein
MKDFKKELAWEEKHLAFLYPDILEFAVVNDAKKHAALVLVKPLLKKLTMRKTGRLG